MKKIIEAIIQWLAHWDKDKLLHVMIVMIVALTTASILHIAGFATWIVIVGSLVSAAIAAVGKRAPGWRLVRRERPHCRRSRSCARRIVYHHINLIGLCAI